MPPFPFELRYLWAIFHRIRRRMGGTGFGPQPVGWPDLDAFLRLSGVALAPWEIGVIEQLDDAFLSDPNAQPDLIEDF